MTEPTIPAGGLQGPPLLDRESELAALTREIGAVAAGIGGVLLIEGGPGAGKTRLVAEARRLAADAGVRVLAARGGELEREYPYGVVRQLFDAALLGPDGEDWFGGPAEPARSVFLPQPKVEAAAFAALNGLYWLTANAAAAGPLVLLIDDLHWADRPSLGYLQFLARRLAELPVLLIIAGRPAESDVLAELAADPAATVLRPGALTEDAAARVTVALLGVSPSERFARASWVATGGNPLLLVELLRTLRAEQVVPDDAHLGEVEIVGPSAAARIILVRLRRLPWEVLAVAQAIAVLEAGAELSLIGEFAEVDESTVTRAIEALVQLEIVDTEPLLGFAHPIVRDAIYREITPAERDRRHARAAELLRGRAAAPDQVGAHLLLSAPRGETWVVDALRAAAADAAQRGAVESAITFLRRALAERPGDAEFDLLFRLGMTEAAVDPRTAVVHLRAALRIAPEPAARTRVGEMITRMLAFFDPPGAVAAARRTRSELPAEAADRRAALVAIERHAARFNGGSDAPPPEPVPEGPGGAMLKAVQAWELALDGGAASECAALAADALGVGEPGAGAPRGANTIFAAMVASSVLIFADDLRAEPFWQTWTANAVKAGRADWLIAANIWRAAVRVRMGRLADAEAAVRAVIDGDWGPGTNSVPAHTLATLAEVLIERGDLAAAEVTLDSVTEPLDATSEGALVARFARARLRSARGQHQAVFDELDPVLDRLRTIRNPAWWPWRSLRAETLAQIGRDDEAVGEVTDDLELARRWGTPGPIGRALTLLGTLTERTELLAEAVEVTRSPFARLQHARALLARGQALRRSGQPREARRLLRDAEELAGRCGAEVLAQQARAELAVAGGRPRTRVATGSPTLTPSERRVAELAAAGRANREIAQQLYLSQKTVEVHLSSTYRKLGIRARGELSSVLEVGA